MWGVREGFRGTGLRAASICLSACVCCACVCLSPCVRAYACTSVRPPTHLAFLLLPRLMCSVACNLARPAWPPLPPPHPTLCCSDPSSCDPSPPRPRTHTHTHTHTMSPPPTPPLPSSSPPPVQLPDPSSGRGPFDVMLCTYTMFEKDSAEHKSDRAFLSRWRWGFLVADEVGAGASLWQMRRVRGHGTGDG